jgi:hypothetical protein
MSRTRLRLRISCKHSFLTNQKLVVARLKKVLVVLLLIHQIHLHFQDLVLVVHLRKNLTLVAHKVDYPNRGSLQLVCSWYLPWNSNQEPLM